MSFKDDKAGSSAWTGLFGSRRKAWLWYTEGSQRVAPASVTNWSGGEVNSGLRCGEIHTTIPVSYNKSTIEEANNHLQALMERIEELEDILLQQNKLLGVKDQQLRKALKDIERRSQQEKDYKVRLLTEMNERAHSLELMLAQMSGEESALLEISQPLDIIRSHRSALIQVTNALSAADDNLQQRIIRFEDVSKSTPPLAQIRRSSGINPQQLIVSKQDSPGRASLHSMRHSVHFP